MAANLAQVIARQILKVVEGARHLIAGETLAAEFLQTLGIEHGTIAQGDAADDVLRAILARAAYGGDVHHVGVLGNRFFYLSGVDVETTGDDDFFDAADQLDIAIRLHECHIAGAEPAIVEGFSVAAALPK